MSAASAAQAPAPALGAPGIVRRAVPAGLVAGVVMLGVLTSISEVVGQPTAVPGIDSSTWTPLTALTALVFGQNAFHGDFDAPSILFGGALLTALAVGFGLVGVAFIVVTQGPRPGLFGAAVQGVAYGLFLQVALVNLLVNAIQDRPVLYHALPSWGWWVAHAFYGATLGLVVSAQG